MFIAAAANDFRFIAGLWAIEESTNEKLLTIMASSMLVIATFAVSSMIAAYASASTTATPRSFPLIVADDVSQTALSAFIGAFIFSIVALVAVKNGYYDNGSHFVLFAITIGVFGWVVLTFVRWVDTIARLGRIRNTVDKVESAVLSAITRRRRQPYLGGVALDGHRDPGRPVHCDTIGYVQQIDMESLQKFAKEHGCRITIAAIPGAFLAADRALAHFTVDDDDTSEIDDSKIVNAFMIGKSRVFDDDPRYGLIVLSEIASRALSPAVNDPGSAIDIIGSFVRLFAAWNEPLKDNEREPPTCDRVHAPGLAVSDMFDDAFTGLSRDGAMCVEVGVRLQKAFAALASTGASDTADAARRHSRRALAHAQYALKLTDEIKAIRHAAGMINQPSHRNGASR